jgi:transposase
MGRYSGEFKKTMVKKLLTPGGPSAMELSRSSGVSETTLSRWLQEAASVALMSKAGEGEKPPSKKGRRPEDWSAEDRLRVVRATAGLEGAELGAVLRREGLHSSVLEEWRREVEASSLAALGGQRQRTREQKRIRELERELRRKDKALAEAAALLVLSKKVQALWADEDDDTSGKSE